MNVIRSAGYTDLVARQAGAGKGYSYVFSGQSGYLDHALANASLARQVRGAVEWHINADEPRVLDYNVEFKTLGSRTACTTPSRTGPPTTTRW